MKAWLFGVSATAILTAGFYLVAPKPAESVPAAAAPEAVAAVPSQPPAPLPPAIVDRVVDVTDIDHLLEPPPIPVAAPAEPGPVITRVGYEESASPKPANAVVPVIPMSRE